MIALAAAVATQIAEAPLLKTFLPNGAVVVGHRVESPLVSAHLFVRATEREDASSHGHRHLLEHLVAKGGEGTLDRRLEARGLYLSAATSRDFIRIEIAGPAREWRAAVDGLREMLAPLRISEEAIRREAQILDQELAITPVPIRMAAAAWRRAFGEACLDPLGSGEGFRSATPESLRALRDRCFVGARLVVVVSGPVLPVEAVVAARTWVEGLPPGKPADFEEWGSFAPGSDALVPGSGRGRGARLPAIGTTEAIATLAAGMALAGADPDWRLLASPSARAGLALLWREGGGDLSAVDLLDREARGALYPRGRAAARAWLDGADRDPRASTLLRGTLLVADPRLSPESLRRQLDSMTEADFSAALGRFFAANSVGVALAP